MAGRLLRQTPLLRWLPIVFCHLQCAAVTTVTGLSTSLLFYIALTFIYPRGLPLRRLPSTAFSVSIHDRTTITCDTCRLTIRTPITSGYCYCHAYSFVLCSRWDTPSILLWHLFLTFGYVYRYVTVISCDKTFACCNR